MKWSENALLNHPGLPSSFNPAQAEGMAWGCRVQARDKAESTRLADAAEGTSEGPVAETTQTMQTFLGYFHPAQAEGETLAVRFAVPNTQLQSSRAAECASHP